MALAITLQTKFFRLFFIAIIFTILCVILLLDDTVIAKFKCSHSSCGVNVRHRYYQNYTDKSPLPLHFTIKFIKETADGNNVIDVLFLFAHSNENHELRNKFSTCLKSLLSHTIQPLNLHVITDNSSVQDAVQMLRDAALVSRSSSLEVFLYDVVNISTPLKTLIASMQPYFSYKLGAYYSDALFYISTGIFKVLPLQKVIMLDIDVKFLDDIKDLYAHFKHFNPDAVIGIAREQQPVYRHILHVYRRLHNNTRAGAPPPNGLTGFNSGVLLLDLDKMRQSVTYSSLINSTAITNLVEKYKFKGHLGDQDFYSLVSLDHEELFYVLPCTWNRQLCQWWRRHGYEDVFDDYYTCSGKIKLLHGNCNTFIPS